MRHRGPALAVLIALSALAPAKADNAMGYRLVTPQEASALPRNSGALGLDLQGAEMIQEPGMDFEIMRVSRVRDRSPGARAGFRPGDELISVDGRVFPSLKVFAAYVGSLQPDRPVNVDYIPAGGGPAQAKRVQVVPGASGSTGLSTREKVAIGVGAAALFGCYEMGCFAHRQPAQAAPPGLRNQGGVPQNQGYAPQNQGYAPQNQGYAPQNQPIQPQQ